MEVDEKLLNKTVKLVFDDGEKPFRMTGRVLTYNATFLVIDSDGRTQTIPISRIIRIEGVV